MTAPLPWRVFKVNDCDWYIARTLEEAIATWVRDTGWNDCDDFEDARELSEAELDRLKFIEDRELPREDWVRRTFREELDRRSASGAPEDRKPGMFASTEY
jgi:hypothetical protein